MRGAKELDSRLVQLLRDVTTNGGVKFHAGDVGVFRKIGVVRCRFTREDGATFESGHMQRSDFRLLSGDES